MKILRFNIVAVMVMMIVIASAGCSSKPQVGSTVSYSSIFSTNYKWIEYKYTGNDPVFGGEYTSNVRVEKSTASYQGAPAILLKTTTETTAISGGDSGSASSISEVYFSTSMKTVLGGTTTSTDAKGHTTIGQVPGSGYVDMPSGVDFNNTMLTYKGPVSVTVPLGTYSNADMYTFSKPGVSASLWMVSGIPVPVKWTGNTEYEKMTSTLVSWG